MVCTEGKRVSLTLKTSFSTDIQKGAQKPQPEKYI